MDGGVAEQWARTLESERAWTDRLRAEREKNSCKFSDLVIVVAPASDYPRTSRIATVVNDFVIVVGRVDDLLGACLPLRGLDALANADRSAQPDHAHAAILCGPGGYVLRFRVPS